MALMSQYSTGYANFIIHSTQSIRKMSDREFFEFCQKNRNLRIEQTSEGDLIIMPPTGGETGRRNFELSVLFGIWAKSDGTGIGFDSSTAFRLPNGARRAPDLAWMSKDRWNQLTAEEREVFPPLCPDFVVELRSPSDQLNVLQDKMAEYIANGARLGWLIDPLEKMVWVYKPDAEPVSLNNPETVAGEAILPGFELSLESIWG